MSKLFWASMAGNILLAVSAYFLFSSNMDLNKTVGTSAAQIQSYAQNEKAFETQVAQCRADKVFLITEHTRQINQIREMSDARASQIRNEISRIMTERGALEKTLRSINRPVEVTDAAERVRRVEAMLDSYITEYKK